MRWAIRPIPKIMANNVQYAPSRNTKPEMSKFRLGSEVLTPPLNPEKGTNTQRIMNVEAIAAIEIFIMSALSAADASNPEIAAEIVTADAI